MDAVRLKNLRNLEDTGFIQIKPITFLLGSNRQFLNNRW